VTSKRTEQQLVIVKSDVAAIFTMALRDTLRAKLRFILDMRQQQVGSKGCLWGKKFWFLMCAVLDKRVREGSGNGGMVSKLLSDELFVKEALRKVSRASE
jgi:hypothetical protein